MNLKLLTVASVFAVVMLSGCITGGMVVNSGDKVSIDYVAYLTDLNHTFDKGTISFVVSEHTVIPGMEAGVIGMKAGEEKTFTVPPSLAYGEYDNNLLIPIQTAIFNGSLPNLYDKVTMFSRDGMVVNVSDDWVVVDLNHWLAGYNITFDVKMLTIEKV